MVKYCLKCGKEVESDDNFCPVCGYWTPRGYSILNSKSNSLVINGKIVKQQSMLSRLFILLFLSMFLFVGMIIYRGQDILKPFVFVKRQIMNYNYGYNTTILKVDNQYFNLKIPNLMAAQNKIKEDFNEQKWQCKDSFDIGKIEDNLEAKYNILSVDFCDISIEEANKIASVIVKVYELFPNMGNYLTNISVNNSLNKDDYVAYFQPVYQFVNSTNSLDNYNRVNKTQILLNSYYFSNGDVLSKSVKENWYVSGATWESLIAHEFGHYILFVSLLKNKGVDNVLLVTRDNVNSINDIINIINDQSYSRDVVYKAMTNYNNKYDLNYDVLHFAKLISNYAAVIDKSGNAVYDEIVAEAFHDYYLHGSSASKASSEVVNILKLS